MNPKITLLSEENDVYKFTVSNINVSLANALRRIILSEIPTLVFYTETYNDNKCNILVNTGRLHNEIVKHRLSCIPIHIEKEQEMNIFVEKYVLELDVKNDTESMIIVTTENFRIKDKVTQQYMSKEEVRTIFPPNQTTQSYIDFIRLRPKIGDSISGEHIKLTCEFSISNAKQNSMFNVVSKCSYGNTPDMVKVNEIWDEIETKLKSEDNTLEEIDFQKKNFYLLDAQRQFVADSFDFVIQTVGVFENKYILKKACSVLESKFELFEQSLDDDIVPITLSETAIEHSYDIILENEDYTIGKVLEYFLYDMFYIKNPIFTYCGFKKMHPHNLDSIIRIAYEKNTDKHMLQQHLKEASINAKNVFKTLNNLF